MRRSLLTASLAFVPMGGDTTADTSNLPTTYVWGGTPASTAGTITSVSARFGVASQALRFFTIRDVAGTWTIQTASGNLSTLLGVNAYSVSLAVTAGDLLGVWSALAGGQLRYVASGTGTYYRSTTAGSPDPTETLTVTQTDTNHTYAFVGTP